MSSQTIGHPAPAAHSDRRDGEALAPHVIVLFGATGDLARRKLIPGLAYLDQSELAPNIEIVATSLEDISVEEFRALAKEAVKSFGSHQLTKEQWARFAETITYVPQGAGPGTLAAAVAVAEVKLGPEVRRLHYHRCPPRPPGRLSTMLRDAQLVERSRVVMEKPFGTDLSSAVALNDFVHETFREEEIFASTTSWARRPRKTSWPSASPTACSNRSGTATSSTTSKSTSPKPWASTNAPTSTRAPAPTRTWWSPTCFRSWRSS